MARTPSTMLPLGTQAPAFSLTDATTGSTVSLDDFQGPKALVIMFICNHCPFVKHLHDGFASLLSDYKAALEDKSLAIVGISPNDIENYPDDSPEKMKELAAELGWNFPYLFDDTQEVAKAYNAACTPDFYVFNADHKLAYRGQFDESRPKTDIPVTGADLRAAIDALLAGDAPSEEQMPSIGCNIKWIKGNEPAYFATA